jgi:hypothetical protein
MSFIPGSLPTRGRRIASLLLSVLTAATLAGLAVVPASAAVVCTGDICVVEPDVVQTPLGPVTVTVSDANVVTVHLDPASPNTLLLGIPFALPPGPPTLPGCPGGCSRTTIDTSGGLVTIDEIQIPPGPPGRIALPSLAIVSIHPPSPCRVRISRTTVVFTPIIPPGPPA